MGDEGEILAFSTVCKLHCFREQDMRQLNYFYHSSISKKAESSPYIVINKNIPYAKKICSCPKK